MSSDILNVKIGVLALQGAFREHINAIRKCGAEAVEIKFAGQLGDIDGLIIPGGESTTISKLIAKYNFRQSLEQFFKSKKPIFGTCAGLILLSNKVESLNTGLGFIDIDVKRNAYGRQIESFEQDINIELLSGRKNQKYKAVFIRAPVIKRIGKNVSVLATIPDQDLSGEDTVFARSNNVIVCSFHPELTDDLSIHRYFIDMVKKSKIMVKFNS